MARVDKDLGGKVLGRTHRRDRVAHDDGELTHEDFSEFTEHPDGTVEKVITGESRLLACGHPTQRGLAVAVCEACSREQGRTAFVCERCAVNCAQCGSPLCQRHTQRGPDNERYCEACYAKLFGGGNGLGRLVRAVARWW